MSSTRPIPIGSSGSQRGSPVTRSPNGAAMVSHSLPADMHHVHLSRFMTTTSSTRSGGLQPPRAPRVGSMPEPNFLQLDSMPDLALGPPAETIEEDSPPARAPAVIQFASSCPGDIGFLRRNPTRSSWTPTLEPYVAEHEDFDLSKSPALAAMSALRERMQTEGTTQQAGNGSSYRSFSARGAAGTQTSRHYYASDESSSYAVSAELLERLSITSEEGEEREDRDERYRMPGYDLQTPADQRRRSERRGSYGNVSDTGDTGIFEFDDQ
ncbi:hypothetical protein PPTG_00239 [Phytophthora nicotianae INRA-310]|uniref:Uncharacterized protein n=3 Tax=Phytophthora nicotianae TaxID=4792 RepID=W2RE86_PHYN3|nr:hypothetical protein PPTG_00239 [Phytophthora nicotianae INRA-310]ETN23702.1 hypothetical protein PPTG_00239 [Phytophthora nicotianae INRA-310]ETO86142.1 hypothetical protein F444_00294 [Phytophthora nicotianae P1976]KUF93701.1 hypothetical protein AM587_10013910 [Phytophthora nicotianae]